MTIDVWRNEELMDFPSAYYRQTGRRGGMVIYEANRDEVIIVEGG